MNIRDKRGREWEMFNDASYYDMWCVRTIHDKSFNSHVSFHFAKKADADMFFELVRRSQ